MKIFYQSESSEHFKSIEKTNIIKRILGICWDRSIAMDGLSNHMKYSTLNTHTDWLVRR